MNALSPFARAAAAPFLLLLALASPAPAESPGESAFQEGEKFFAARDYTNAVLAYNRALNADPNLGKAWGRRGTAWRYTGYDAEALHDLDLAVSLDPDTPEWRFQKAKSYLDQQRPQDALEVIEAAVKKWPEDAEAVSIHGWALAAAGEVDRGVEEGNRALKLCGGKTWLVIREVGLHLKTEWAELEKDCRATIASGQYKLNGVFMQRTLALVELGKYDEAADAVTAASRVSNGAPWMIGRVWLESTPAAGKHFNPGQAMADVKALSIDMGQMMVVIAMARAYLLCGRPGECLDLLETKGARTNFEVLFWLGAAQWKLGRFPEARETLAAARQLNPYLVRHADRMEGMRDFVVSVDAQAGKAPPAAAAERNQEVATWLLRAAEIEMLVREYRFEAAAAALDVELGRTAFPARKAEIGTRLAEVRGLQGALKRLVESVNAKSQKFTAKAGSSDLEIVAATAEEFEFKVATGGGKFPWACLGAQEFARLALLSPVTPDERLGLGWLLWDAGLRAATIPLLEEAVKKQAALKKQFTAGMARRKGVAEPQGGFVVFRGAYVSPEEKKNLEKGLILYEGRWISSQEREARAKGLVPAGGKWIPAEEAELLARGFRKRDGKWLSREEIDALCGDWANAWTEETTHYSIRTNAGEQFAKDLALVCETNYAALRDFYGGREPSIPKGEKMTLFAFRAYEDYRKYCVDHNAQDFLNAAGFARSDSTTVVGWNKAGTTRTLLQTMTHEAAHLYFYRIAPSARPPSWFAEAMATYFEGFKWTGKEFAFDFRSDMRLPFVRDAMKKGAHLPLATLLESDALSLINKDHDTALLFYAECWALNYFLTKTDNPAWKNAYAEYRTSVERGGADPLSKFVTDMPAMEKAWVAFVKGM